MSWVITALAGGTALGIGGGIVSSSIKDSQAKDEFGRQQEFADKQYADQMAGWKNNKPQFYETPRFAETDKAREAWSNTLQDWGSKPGYGAIQPDWNNIWNTAQKKVQQYFWGSATGPGIVDKLRASTARRGVSESPANEELLTRLGAEEAGQYRDLATDEASKKAALSESGRQTWLGSMTQLANLQKQGIWDKPGMPPTQTYVPSVPSGQNWGDVMSSVGGGVASYASNKQQQDWLSGILGKNPTATPNTIIPEQTWKTPTMSGGLSQGIWG
ncbi:MAG: hypothetical protein WC810_02975 [Janthinobacterium sp.]|jgi:hypothetical protein